MLKVAFYSGAVVAALFAPTLKAQEPTGANGEDFRGSLYTTSIHEDGHVHPRDVSGLITEDTTMFAVIDAVDGDRLTLHMLDTVMSRDATVFVFVGDEIQATLLPLEPGNTRQAVCVSTIVGQEGTAVPVSGPPENGCIGFVTDFRGRMGLPIDGITVDTVTRIRLTGDIVMDDPK